MSTLIDDIRKLMAPYGVTLGRLRLALRLRNRVFFPRMIYYAISQQLKVCLRVPRSSKNAVSYANVAGVRLAILGNDYGLGRELKAFGVHEPSITRLLMLIAQHGDVVLDIGANIGYYALILARLVGEEGRVYAFEPEPTNFSLLKRNVAMNGYNNVICINAALGDKKKYGLLHRVNFYPNLSSVINEAKGKNSIKVQLLRLDDFVRESSLSKVNLIRLDVEGYEWAVIEGGRDTIARWEPSLCIEIHPQNREYRQTKEKLAYLCRIYDRVILTLRIFDHYPNSTELTSFALTSHELNSFLRGNHGLLTDVFTITFVSPSTVRRVGITPMLAGDFRALRELLKWS